MSETIDELLVKLGLDIDKKQYQQAGSLFDGLKSKALQFGAVIGTGFGLNNLTFGFAQANDRLSHFSKLFSVAPQFVDELGFAFEQVGGDSEDAFNSIRRVADLIERTEWGEIPVDAFREAGFDPYLLEGVNNVADAYERIASAAEMLDPESARRALGALGFGDEEIRLFRQGPDTIRAQMADARQLAEVSQEMITQAEDFQRGISRLGRSLTGFSNEISAMFVGDLANGLNSIADFLAENRDEIKDLTEKSIPILTGIASGIGVLVALQAGRAAIGALSGIPGATILAGGIGAGVFIARDKLGEGLSGGIGQVAGTAGGLARAGTSAYRYGLRSDEFGNAALNLLPGPIGTLAQGAKAAIEISGDINVDARNSSDPQATEISVRRAIEEALQRAAENTITDLSGVTQ